MGINKSSVATYSQPSKQKSREKALRHALELVTVRRSDAAIVSSNYVERVNNLVTNEYEIVGAKASDIESWKNFRDSSVGCREPSDITVAYLAGPEPTNDLELLINFGVRPENIWAFEIEGDVFEAALKNLEASKLRGVKIININIDAYFKSTPRRFDIIYFDACGPFPSKDSKTTKVISSIFRNSALSTLGVLVTNFSVPDFSKAHISDNYTHLISSYLYPKAFLDSFESQHGNITDGAEAKSFIFGCVDEDEFEVHDSSVGTVDCSRSKDFSLEVKNNFVDYYGSFITRNIIDIASIISPSIRIFNSPLSPQLVLDVESAWRRADLFTAVDDSTSERMNDDEAVGQAFYSSSMFSLLYTMHTSGKGILDGYSLKDVENVRKFCSNWMVQLGGDSDVKNDAIKAVKCFYSLRHDDKFWSNSLKNLASFDYWNEMKQFCDVATTELAFYPVFAQLSYPAHANIRETKRFTYKAEDKKTTMMLDVIPFDECRYVYDWLSTAPLVGNDWKDHSRQFVFRFALDAIAKNIRWYQDDFLYGCHSVSIGDLDEPPELSTREVIDGVGKA